jgi:hypothetical protein
MAESLAIPTREQVDEAIRQTALDYIEGWYDGDPARMERSLHPDLAKRIVISNPDGSGDRLDQMSALTVLRAARHDPIPVHERHTEVIILDRFENEASLKLFGDSGEYAHLAKWNGQWVIVNILSGLRPRTEGDADDTSVMRAARDYPLQRSFHTELAKRAVGPVRIPSPEWPSPSWPPGDKLYQLSVYGLMQGFGDRLDHSDPKSVQKTEPRHTDDRCTLLDRGENAVSVRSDGPDNIDYLHLAKWNGQWLIINVLWELTPKAAAVAATRDAARVSRTAG